MPLPRQLLQIDFDQFHRYAALTVLLKPLLTRWHQESHQPLRLLEVGSHSLNLLPTFLAPVPVEIVRADLEPSLAGDLGPYITIQKDAEAALQQALAKEKELGDLKTRFVSMASHEFRIPLATLLATVETLSAYRDKLSEEQIDQRLEKMRVQIGHLKNIMDDVLLLSRMQARRFDFNPTTINLDTLTRSV